MVGLSRITRPVGRVVATAQNGIEVLRYGGLGTATAPSPFAVVDSVPMYRLRRYFPPDPNRSSDTGTGTDAGTGRPPVLMVHPMMMSADMWDVSRADGAVGILHAADIDPWVIDFGSPDRVEGGMERTLTDHLVAVGGAIDTVRAATGRDVHLAGYSQGGMFCYQTAAWRRSAGIASIVAFGAPVDTLAALPLGIPAGMGAAAADFLADHVFTHLDVPGWLARAGFQLLDPVKTAQARLDFLRQLHDREALLPRENQRRFLASDGWIAWSGPAISELLKQFVAHNRMMTGGFSVDGELVTLGDISCPVLAVVGEVDDIGQPASVRGIRRAAPAADVHEYLVRTGHFGLVVGSRAAESTWPTVAGWVNWLSGGGERPVGVEPMEPRDVATDERGVTVASRLAHGAAVAAEVSWDLARSAAETVIAAQRSMRSLATESVRTLPRLARLGQITDHTVISLGKVMAEQAAHAPDGDFLLFDGRVHTHAAVDRRVDAVVRGLLHTGVRQGTHVGVLMATRPSALVAVAALSRLGAVAVMLPPDVDLAAAARLGGIEALITDPAHLDAARSTGVRVLVLGGGEARRLDVPDASPGDTAPADVVDMERIDPATVTVPGWYRPDPGHARDLAFIVFGTAADRLVARQITNQRWALSAFGTASSANLGRSDTVYCLTPLHHRSSLLVALGGAVVGGSRIALSRGLDPERFVAEVRRYGVTVVSYTWAMLHEVLTDPAFTPPEHHPIRLFVGSGMPIGLWSRVQAAFAPATVVEFFATADGQAVLANVTGAKVGSKGRPVPGSGRIALAAVDDEGRPVIDERGFVRPAGAGETGLLLTRSRGPIDPQATVLRGVFAPADTWISTGYLFRRDDDGDHWLVGHRATIVHTDRGPVHPEAITDVVGRIDAVDLVVTDRERVGDADRVVTRLTVRPGERVSAADLDEVLAALPAEGRPDVVAVVEALELGASWRPAVAPGTDALPRAGRTSWYLHAETGRYRPLTAAVRARYVGARPPRPAVRSAGSATRAAAPVPGEDP